MQRHKRDVLYLIVITMLATLAFGPLVMAQSSGGWSIVEQSDTRIVLEQDAVDPEPTATSEPDPTATLEPEPTATVDDLTGWHAAGSHDGLNPHEHGIVPPPDWVLASDHQPFNQDRESHTGYKGVYDVSPGGVESYFIAHVIATVMARSHGDHDYQLWLRDPETGAVSYWDGVLCFARPCTAQTPERTTDTGERPIILSVNDGGCETWYSQPGMAVADVGWTICGRYQRFDGVATDNTGTFRTVDWIIPCDRLPSSSALQNNCRTEFGIRRLTFLVNSAENDPDGIAEPVN